MKKTLLTLITLLATTLAHAGEYTITFSEQGYANAEDIATVTIGNVTATLDKGTNKNGPKYYTTGTALRLYGGNSISFSSAETIVGITFTVQSSNPFNAGTTASTGTLSEDFNTWTGSANEVTITNGGTSGHARIVSITINTTAGGDQPYVATPRTTLAEGTYYTLPQTVGLTAAEGCTIYYSLNGAPATAYTQPIELTSYGTYTLTAYAQDKDNNKSEEISRTYTLAEAPTYTTLAQLKAACTATSQSEAPTVVLQARDFTVTAVGKSYTFISDPQGGAFLLYGSQTALKAGDKFQGSITGQLYIYKGTHELAFTDGLQNVTVTGQTELTPAVFSYDDFRYDNDESKLFILKNAKFKDGALTSSQVTVLDNETNEITLRDQFGILGSFNTEDTYNITMVSSKYSEAEVFYPTALENVTNQHQAESIANTPETAYTVARAIELTDAGESLTDSVYVKGIVSKVNTPKTFDGKLNIYVKDSSEAEADFEFYLCQNIGNQPFTTASDINVGDTLIAKGTLKKYNSTYELNSGCYLVSRKAIEVAPYEEYVPTGAGTEESPYTVADIIGIYENSQHIEGYQLPAEAVWATGTILGNVNTSTGATVVPDEEKPAVNSNLSLGNQDDGTHISVQLSAGEIRAALNILDNPGNLGKQVSVCGKIDKYCGIPGLKSLTAYSGIDLSISTVLSLIKSYVNGENKSIKMSDITTLIEKLAQQQQQ